MVKFVNLPDLAYSINQTDKIIIWKLLQERLQKKACDEMYCMVFLVPTWNYDFNTVVVSNTMHQLTC